MQYLICDSTLQRIHPIINIYRLLFVESNPIPVKWMLSKMGMIENSIRLPLIELDETYHDEILSELNKLKLI